MFQVEPAFVDSLVNAFRRSPVSHKLGVLYIIDSIARQWVASGVAHAGGVRRMTENLPSLMTELLPVTPEGQKVCICRYVL
jgi:protein NRD1